MAAEEYNNAAGPEINKRRGSGRTERLALALTVVICFIAGCSAATQYFAAAMNYHPYLGDSLFAHVYNPFAVFEWTNDPRLFQFKNQSQLARQMVFIGLVLGIIIVAVYKLVNDKSYQGNKYLHGSAHWASEKDMEAAGLYKVKKRPVVYVGGFLNKKRKFQYLMHAGPEHILCYAPTRSGKGVGLVMPTMLSWTDSAIVNDIKGELWALTSGWRSKYANNRVIKWEPAAMDSAHWNPLDEIRIFTVYEVSDVQNLASLIVDPDGQGMDGHDGHWKKTAYALYTGLFLYVLHRTFAAHKDSEEHIKRLCHDRTEITAANLHVVDRILSASGEIQSFWDEMISYPEIMMDPKGDPTELEIRKIIASAGQDMKDRPDAEAGSVLSTVKSNLSLYRDPIVSANSQNSDFRIRDLMHGEPDGEGGEKPSPAMTVYMVQQPADKGRVRPIVRIFISMCMRVLADKMEFAGGRSVFKANHKVLVMLDEFPALGKMDIVQESLAFVAGYGIKCYLITQDLEQLRNAYGEHESITSNCHVQIAFPAMNPITMKHLSEMTGTTTIVKESITKSGRGLSASVSRSMQEHARPLLTPDECKNLPGPKKEGDKITEAGDMLVFVAGYPAIYGKQPLYFMDPVFSARSKLPSPDGVIGNPPGWEPSEPAETKSEAKETAAGQETKSQEKDAAAQPAQAAPEQKPADGMPEPDFSSETAESAEASGPSEPQPRADNSKDNGSGEGRRMKFVSSPREAPAEKPSFNYDASALAGMSEALAESAAIAAETGKKAAEAAEKGGKFMFVTLPQRGGAESGWL